MATFKLSKALRSSALQRGSWKNSLQGGRILLYTGAAPTNAEDAVTGTLLATFTANGSAFTAETQAVGSMTLTGGASGSINTVTVNGVNLIANVGAVSFNASLNQTASDLANAINRDQSSPRYTAIALGAVVSIYPQPGVGAGQNGFVVTATLTTITATFSNIAGGANGANGLRLSSASVGVIGKDPTQIWRASPVANGTAGYFRFLGPFADAGGIDTNESFPRLQGDVGTAGTVLTLITAVLAIGQPIDLNTFSITQPAS
jgi:hypothetical protein